MAIDLRPVRKVLVEQGLGKLAAEVLRDKGFGSTVDPGWSFESSIGVVAAKYAANRTSRRAIVEGLLAAAALRGFTP